VIDGRRTHGGLLAARIVGILLLAVPSVADALPMYGARSGRTCDNCHSLPNTWFDPEEFWRRKCTLSCNGCHVDPAGGGMRNVSGRYFGESTLPMFGARIRPLQDVPREVVDFIRGVSTGEAPSSQPASQPAGGVQVATQQEDPRGPGAPPADRGWVTLGRPLLHGSSEMAWLDGRYEDLQADPLLQVGGDFRAAFWSQGPLFFPMQADLSAAVHPVEHLTIMGVFGARGRSRNLVFDNEGLDDQPRFGVRDLWVMTSEWPAMSWLRVGRFMPAFGTRVADHTAYIRRNFGLSQEDPANRVLGVEIGINPNYPYLIASAFKTTPADARDPLETASGEGGSISAGYRHMGWQAGVSGMIRNRPLDEGGDTLDGALSWAWNPWYYWGKIPLTYLGEFVIGRYQRNNSGTEAWQLAHYHQLAWTALNGIVARLRYDMHDGDLEVKDDDVHRPGVGVDLTFIEGITLSVDGRAGLTADGSSADLFVQIHGWF
jgi:hypothetical protein